MNVVNLNGAIVLKPGYHFAPLLNELAVVTM